MGFDSPFAAKRKGRHTSSGRGYPTLGGRRLGTIVHSDIQTWVSTLSTTAGLATSTVRVIHGTSRPSSSLRCATDDSRRARAKEHDSLFGSVGSSCRFEPTRLRAEVPHELRALVTFTAGTGMRQREVFGVTRDRLTQPLNRSQVGFASGQRHAERVRAYESWASSPASRKVMLANRSKDTSPELAVRRRLHAAGFRYRVAYRPEPSLRRTADIVFTKQRIAVFIDGCYWHACPEHGTVARSNASYWSEKLQRNVARDADTTKQLNAAGWTVLRFWEHEDPDEVVAAVVAAVRAEHRTLETSRTSPRGRLSSGLEHRDVGPST